MHSLRTKRAGALYLKIASKAELLSISRFESSTNSLQEKRAKICSLLILIMEIKGKVVSVYHADEVISE